MTGPKNLTSQADHGTPASRGLAAAASGLEPPAKKKKVADSGGDLDWMASDVADIRDIDLEVYGNSGLDAMGAAAGASRVISSYTFDVCDSLLNLGPCGNVAMGEPAFLSEEFAATKR